MDNHSSSVSDLSVEDARDLIENAHCGLVVTDRDGRITFSNTRFASWTGRTTEALATLRLRDLLDTGSQISYDTHILPMLILQGYAREILCRLQPLKGNRVPILLNAGLLPARGDRPARVEFTIFDATERSMYESELRRGRDDAEELASIVRSAVVAILRVDRQGRVSRWNEAAVEMFGFSAEQAYGSELSRLVQLEGEPNWVQIAIEAAKSKNRFEKLASNGLHLNITVSKIADPSQFNDSEQYSFILRDVTQRVTSERRLKVVLQELNHRVKNTLAVVNSIARRTFASPGSKAEKLKFETRLQALAQAHDMLVKNNWESGSLRDIVAVTVQNSGHEDAFRIEGPDIRFPPSDLTMVSMMLVELTTNAIKHGALSQPEGRVHLTWSLSADNGPIFTLEWVEQSSLQIKPPTTRGFGSQMLERLVTAELNGTAEIKFGPDGLQYRLTAPHGDVV